MSYPDLLSIHVQCSPGLDRWYARHSIICCYVVCQDPRSWLVLLVWPGSFSKWCTWSHLATYLRVCEQLSMQCMSASSVEANWEQKSVTVILLNPVFMPELFSVLSEPLHCQCSFSHLPPLSPATLLCFPVVGCVLYVFINTCCPGSHTGKILKCVCMCSLVLWVVTQLNCKNVFDLDSPIEENCIQSWGNCMHPHPCVFVR